VPFVQHHFPAHPPFASDRRLKDNLAHSTNFDPSLLGQQQMQQPMFSGTPALFSIGCHSYVDWMVVLVIAGAAAMNMRGCVHPKKPA
jgi:hypothetical protein